ncbi:OB-fold protein [Oligella urethralis]|uniref:OB-fold protein n=1 Tax=Oligella urethralis TaxID=90245 RepID=UPI000DF8749B|nr:hypothetical protein [Oligella urethralis]SUA58057.1 tRNA_anti-like [Oligella urethralis]
MKKLLLSLSILSVFATAPMAQEIEVGFEGTSEQLYQAYNENSVAFKRKTRGKNIVVTGTLNKISENDSGVIVLRMPGSEMISWIDIELNNDQEDKALELKAGQRTTVSCKTIDEMFELVLSDCIFAESNVVDAVTTSQSDEVQNEYITALKNSGVEIYDVKDITDEDFLFTGFKQSIKFSIPEVAPQGGQMFICEEKKLCDPIYDYYDSLKFLAGPFLYQSPKGLVILQLNSDLKEETAKKLESAIAKY